MVTTMGFVGFWRDAFRILRGESPIIGYSYRSESDVDARLTTKRFSRGNVAVQDGRFVSPKNLSDERSKVAGIKFRN